MTFASLIVCCAADVDDVWWRDQNDIDPFSWATLTPSQLTLVDAIGSNHSEFCDRKFIYILLPRC